MMKRKDYQNPTTKVVQLQHRTTLLAGSDIPSQSTVQDYEWQDVVEE